MHIQTMQEFLTLAETLNFLAAADRLYISQATLSKHIREVAVIILFTVFIGRGQDNGIEFQFEETQMTIIGPDGAPNPVTVNYEDILSVSHRGGLELLADKGMEAGIDAG